MAEYKNENIALKNENSTLKNENQTLKMAWDKDLRTFKMEKQLLNGMYVTNKHWKQNLKKI